MADYKQQQMVDTANAVARKRKADVEKQTADTNAETETSRLDRAIHNKAGAGRGAEGGPTAEVLRAAGKAYAKGGSVSSRADGIAQRGKTKGRMC